MLDSLGTDRQRWRRLFINRSGFSPEKEISCLACRLVTAYPWIAWMAVVDPTSSSPGHGIMDSSIAPSPPLSCLWALISSFFFPFSSFSFSFYSSEVCLPLRSVHEFLAGSQFYGVTAGSLRRVLASVLGLQI